MMKNIAIIMLSMVAALTAVSCNSDDKKPYGAEVMDYDKVEGINKEGPIIESDHFENKPPMGDKTTFVEIGPPRIEYPDIKTEPTADMDEYPDYGGLPVIKKGEVINGS